MPFSFSLLTFSDLILYLATSIFLYLLCYWKFAGHIFETQIHVQTQIRLNTILTLATKHLLSINEDNVYLPLDAS